MAVAPQASLPPCVRVVAAGALVSAPRADWAQLAGVVAETAAASPSAALLVDLLGASFDVSSRVADGLARSLANYPIVALLTEHGHSFGCARMVAMLVELRGGSAAVFTDEQAAWNWLSVELGADGARACP